jgi:hypothetical protein
MFACLRDGPIAATIGCFNLRMKQGRGRKYIHFSLTSSNSSWHNRWLYLRNDPEFALQAFTENSIGKTPTSWTNGPPKVEQEKMFKEHWAMLARLRDAGVEMAAVIGQYHAWGVVSL